jgi:hypothetical protein
MTKKIIHPYEAICREDVGSLRNVPDHPPIQFTTRRTSFELTPLLDHNVEVIEQIRREEETMPKTLERSDLKRLGQAFPQSRTYDDSFFKNTLEDSLCKKKNSLEELPDLTNWTPRKSMSFTEFLSKKKA